MRGGRDAQAAAGRAASPAVQRRSALGLQFGIAFDLDARRSAEFPDAMREALASNKRPDIKDQAAE